MSEPTTVPAPAVEHKAEDVKPLEPSTLATEEAAPAETTQAAIVVDETTPAPVALTEDKPAETVAAKEEASIEPIASGVLGYKAPGLIKHFKFSKRYFWLGDEAVSTQHLSHYLRGTEARVAHPVAAWSSQTGKGLLYLVKSEAEKSHPQDVIPLADATDLQKASAHEFSFKIHGDKHTFKAANDAERNGWFLAIEKTIEEAKASKDEIRKSEGYQESVKHLGKPAVLAGGVAAGGVAAAAVKKDEEDTPATEPVEPATARVNSHSSSSGDEIARKEKKEAKKSRSVSRGKRASIFGSLLGKKEDKEAKKEEEKVEEKHAAEGAAAGAVVVGGAAATAVAAEDKPAEVSTESKPEQLESAAPVTIAPLETKEETPVPPKPSKRNSLFGSFYQKVRSPTQEKKESEVGPIVPPKDEAPLTAEPLAPVVNEPVEVPAAAAIQSEESSAEPKADEAVLPAVDATTTTTATEEAVEEKKETRPEVPKKESFLGSLLSKARAKSPATSRRDAKEPAAVEAPAVPAKDDKVVEETKPEEVVPSVAPAAETVAATEAAETPAPTAETTEAKATTPKESRRKSLFGFSSSKKEGEQSEGEKTFDKFGNIFRRPSQAIRRATEKKEADKENTTPVKAEETTAETTIPAVTATEAEEKAATETEKPSETIGDVHADAISVGNPQEANPTVSATA